MDRVEESAQQGLDLPRLIAAVSARKRWIVAPTLAAFLAALALVVLVKPRYTATAKVMLENGESYFTRPEKALADGGAVIDDLTVESEAEAAKSPDVERKALEAMTPADRQEFEGSGGLLSAMLGRVYDDPSDRALDAFANNVNIYPQSKTRVLLFEFTSHDRGAAARGANELAKAFLDSQRDAKDSEAKSASQWLSGQIVALRDKVATAESRIEALRAKSGLLAAGPNGLAVPSQQLSEISAQIATARAAESAAKSRASALISLVRSGRLDDVVSVANDESIRRYAESRVAVKAQIAELGRTLLPGHPRMKELAGQLAGLEREIGEAALKRVRGYEEDARIAQLQVKSLETATADQAKAVTSSDDDQVKLRELEIDAKTARDQLESYLTKYREAIARDAENAVPANGRIIAAALTPSTPSFPKAGATLLLAPLAAFLVSLGLTVARILLGEAPAAARRVSAAAPPRREPQLPFGIEAPARPSEPAPGRGEGETSAWTDAVESFVDKLASASEGERLAIMVAAEGGAGALPVALAAARRLARRGGAALLDLGPSPSWLPDLFDRGLDRGPVTAGLADLIEGAAGFSEATHRDISTSLSIIPSGQGEVDPAGLRDILEALAQSYDFVVVHAPDWREKRAVAALEDMAALLISAPADEIAGVAARARAALRDEPLAIKPIATGPQPQRRERAA